jgi:polyhydroxyalkanoate synthesis regulator phasin
VREALKRYVDAAQSLTEIPRERAERIARRLASNGLIDRDQILGVASDIVARSRENRRRVTGLVASEMRKQISRLGLASKDDVERLRQRVQALEISERRRRQERSKPATPRKRTATAARKKPASRR